MCKIALIFLLWSFVVTCETHAFSFYKSESMYEKVISLLVTTWTKSIQFGKTVIVTIPMETVILIITLIVVYSTIRLIKERPHTPTSTQTRSGSASANVNFVNAMQFGNEGSYKTLYSEARNSYAIKAPNELKEGMDVKSWLIVLEIYLKQFQKSDWLDITISLVDNRVLRRIINLDACCNEPIKGFDSFKRQLCDKFKSTVNWDQLSDLKQSPRESIVDYGEKVTQLVKQIFPKTETSDDIDRLIQDRFVEGLYNQRLREKVRAKMLKMRQIETEKVYKIQDLINYADCKMSSFDKQPFYNSTTSESDALQNRRYATQPNLKQTFGGNFKSNSYPYNNPREPNNQRQDKALNPHQSTQKQVKFEDKGNSEPLHVINAVNLRKRPNRERPVIGVAIFNNTLVNYLCDSGADRTIINTKTFNLIKRHAPGTELEIHSGSELFSCSGPIKILGKVKLSRCIVSREEILKNVEILVTETVFNNDCLLGRDLINKLKHIGPRFEHIKTMVKTMSDETEIVAELKETSLLKDDLNMEAVENARALLKNKIEEVSAKSVLDLKPEKNSYSFKTQTRSQSNVDVDHYRGI
ncbi:hypothetical protein BpHYR1_030232 [Brachionus plicatilis]|uniref:Peptidase A2 domain-containing protein n=1 Tax=Brachionus plicatilis TaxID=10195 RepID=A0A3M7SL66_BRAPC|nr:hypothetical protein BpHYR1_030232 [Brachionus plicatilis]